MAKIAIVDNSLDLLSSTSRALTQAGFEVQQFDCVISLLEQMRQVHPQVVILADGLAAMGVLDFLAVLALDPQSSAVPVVVVAADTRNKLECFRLGCADFVAFPVDDAELLFRIGSVLKRSGINGSAANTAGLGATNGKDISAGLSGSFADVGLVDLLQMLCSAQKSGSLNLQTATTSGSLWFNEGQVIHAAVHNENNQNANNGSAAKDQAQSSLVGEEAFSQLLRAAQSGGQFSFAVQKVDLVVPTIEKRTDHLLLSLASALDEEGS